MDIKYTKDGKKVQVLATINANNYLVQEIYVKEDGTVIPAGDVFATNNLLDEPLLTWQEKQLCEIEKNYEATRKQLKQKLEDLKQKYNRAVSVAEYKLSWLEGLVKRADSDKFKQTIGTLYDFITGKTLFMLIHDYNGYEIRKINDHDDVYNDVAQLAEIWEGRLHGIKLLSLYGKSDGDIAYNLNYYGDGSGNSIDVLYITSDYDDMVDYLTNQLIIRKDYISQKDIESALSLGIKIDDDTYKNYIDKRRKQLESSIRACANDMNKTAKRKADYERELIELNNDRR